MNPNTTGRNFLQRILVVSDEPKKLALDSKILASFEQISLTILEATKIIAWVQQYQPDLIVLNLKLAQIINLQLIAALRLDWLTRTIPIMVITNPASKLQSPEKLDCDAWLIKPYSKIELEQAICSLISTPACEVCRKAV
jgi:CheY-like chemotaxis protein